MKKIMSIFAAAALMAAMVTGCGTNTDVSTDDAAVSKNVSGTVATDGSTSMEKVIGYLSEAYMEENKDRCVTLCGAEIVGGDTPKDDFFDDDYDDDNDDDDDPLDYLHLDDFGDDDNDDDNYGYDRKPLTWGFHFNIKFKR